MAGQDDNNGSQANQDAANADGSKTPTPKELEIAKALQSLETKVDKGAAMNAILQDPDVQKVLRAKAEGKKLSIETADGDSETDPFDSFLQGDDDKGDSNLDQMSNTEMLKGLKEIMTESIRGILKTELQPLKDDVEGGKVDARNDQLRASIVKAKKDYGDDFGKRRDEMVRLSHDERYAGLDATDLYRIASHNDLISALKAARKVEAEDIVTERPSFFSQQKSDKPQNARSGKRGFEAMIDDSYSEKG